MRIDRLNIHAYMHAIALMLTWALKHTYVHCIHEHTLELESRYKKFEPNEKKEKQNIPTQNTHIKSSKSKSNNTKSGSAS